MAPTYNTRKKPAASAGPNFPELTPVATTDAAQRSSYEEIQEDELIALASIYGEDFQRLDTKAGAWKKTEPSFCIHIKSSDEDFGITLHVIFVATYPRSIPLLSIKDDDGLREGTKFKIQKVIEAKPKELVAEEQVMIMEIVDALRDILEDAAKANAIGKEIPSLEEERAIHEATAAQIAREQEEMAEKRRELEDKEEDRMFANMVQDELNRQRAKAKEAKRKHRSPATNKQISLEDEFKERFIFDQPVTLLDETKNPRLFQAVTDKFHIRSGPVSNCYTVRPILKDSYTRLLALKQTDLGGQGIDSASFKSQLRALEVDLEALKKARHRNILEVLDFKVHKTVGDTKVSDSLWTVSILSEYAEKGSLEEFLGLAGSLRVARVRAWTIELLDALRYLHDRGITHQDIHASNILLVRSSPGDITVKIADASFQRQLHVLKDIRAGNTLTLAKSAYWLPPENVNTSKPHYTQKTDVWDFGVVFLQMVFGLEVLQKYASPERVTEALTLSEPLDEIVHKFFKADPKKRPRAFELSSCEFLATDAPIMVEDSSPIMSRLGLVASHTPTTPRGQRRGSADLGVPSSRYREDFNEEGRLGKGGFGEVVKARKKLDGQFYAIKKITQKSTTSLTEVLKEVRLLSQLSHPYVVRYYNTWTEEVPDAPDTEEDTNSTAGNSTSAISHDAGLDIEFGLSTGGLDFISSSGYPAAEFNYESDESSEGEKDTELDEDVESTSQSNSNEYGQGEGKGERLVLKRTRSDSRYQRSTRTILYIQMEYCEKRNLRDLIQRSIYKDGGEIWRLLRQMLEGLAHIHGLNIVHRDLKPENIFIDGALNVRIGDFGLATSGQYSVPDRVNASQGSHHMTTSIGTALYVAPEVRSSVGTYNSKVDMYSLGIILFEMCYPPMLGMERVHVLSELRQIKPIFPADFNVAERAMQADIILSLVNHNQKDRPSSPELLQSGKLPVKMESEIIRQTLAGLSDPSSPYYQKMMGALFSRHTTQAKNLAWDMDTSNSLGAHDLVVQGIVKQKLISIFRRHGALEITRSYLFPRSGHYGSNVVQLLEPSGTLVQLPYDLTMPHARFIAKHAPSISRSYTFGHVFRDRSGCQPQSFGEVDFDIVSDSLDLALKEAEIIKVLDEIIVDFPSLASTQMCFYINHSDLLNIVFEFCRIETGIRSATAESLSKLNIQQWTWQKIRNELRSPLIGVSATSLDDLQRFDFRDTPAKAFQKLKTIFEGTDFFERASTAIAHLSEVVEYLRRLEVHSKVFINPLSSLKESFYKGGILFSCLYDTKRKDVFAAGGRYDSLIRENHPRIGSYLEDRHAVGFSLAWEKLATLMARFRKSSSKTLLKRAGERETGIWTTKRCDVLVASFDPSTLRSAGVELLRQLWLNDISAELAMDSRSPEDLQSKYRDNQHYWVVFIKQGSSLKVKSLGRKDAQDVDIPIPQLVGWLRAEMRDRDHREGNSDHTKLLRHQITPNDHEQDVRVLMAQAKLKKSNRHNIVEQAHMRAASLVHSLLDGPIAAIETTDHVMALIRETRLSDPDSWQKVSQSLPTTERKYIGEIHNLMKTLANQNKDTTRNAFIYNIRTDNSCGRTASSTWGEGYTKWYLSD